MSNKLIDELLGFRFKGRTNFAISSKWRRLPIDIQKRVLQEYQTPIVKIEVKNGESHTIYFNTNVNYSVGDITYTYDPITYEPNIEARLQLFVTLFENIQIEGDNGDDVTEKIQEREIDVGPIIWMYVQKKLFARIQSKFFNTNQSNTNIDASYKFVAKKNDFKFHFEVNLNKNMRLNMYQRHLNSNHKRFKFAIFDINLTKISVDFYPE